MLKLFQKLINRLTRILFPVAVWWWRLTKPKTYGVKVVVENKTGEILLIRVAYIPQAAWVFPGGKIEKGENSQVAAKREVLEEVGIELKSLTHIGEYFSAKWGKRDTVNVFCAKSEDSNLKINDFEIEEAKWFTLSNLPSLPPNNKKILKMYERYKSSKSK